MSAKPTDPQLPPDDGAGASGREPMLPLTGKQLINSIDDLVVYLKHFLLGPVGIDKARMDPREIPADVPPGLATIYREFAGLFDHGGALARQDHLLIPARLRRIDGMIEFALENQGNWTARFPPGTVDPPVYCNWPPERRAHRLACPSLNHFLTTMCLQEAVAGAPNLVADGGRSTPPETALLSDTLPVWLFGCYALGETHSFYTDARHDVLIHSTISDLYIGSHARPLSGVIRSNPDLFWLKGDDGED